MWHLGWAFENEAFHNSGDTGEEQEQGVIQAYQGEAQGCRLRQIVGEHHFHVLGFLMMSQEGGFRGFKIPITK